MIVLDLVKELLEFNLDAEVELYISSDEKDDDFEFELDEYRGPNGNRLEIEVDLNKYVMVDKRDYENMKDELENLEEELTDAQNELEELRNE